jgi:MscS family membrane protein
VWDDALVNAAQRPLSFLIWVLGFGWAVQIVSAAAQLGWETVIVPARQLSFIVLLAWFAVRLVDGVERGVLSPDRGGEPPDHTTVIAIGKLLRSAVIVTAVLIGLQSIGVSVSGVLAAGGIGGIAIGFASKDLLANFFGALMIFLDRPFSVGDWIRSPDRQIEGTVEHIGWRLTRIRTFDQRPLYVPNSTFTQISVENPSRMLNRRIYETIGLRYEDSRQVEQVVQRVREMLQQHPEIDHSRTLIVNFNSFGAYSLDFFVYAFTRTTNWVRYHEIKQEVMLRILEIIHDCGADVAFPTSTVQLQRPEPEP